MLSSEFCGLFPRLNIGRAWSAAELRRKSFKDLHTLWYVVLRERNLLETQLLEMKRVGVLLDMTPVKRNMFRVNPSPSMPGSSLRFVLLQCRKTMARIKYVINERRLAYEGAVQIIAEGNEHEVLTRRERTARRKATLEEKTKKAGEDQAVASQPEVEDPPAVVHRTAAERAAAGLMQG